MVSLLKAFINIENKTNIYGYFFSYFKKNIQYLKKTDDGFIRKF